ncbi:MAG TPA: hypothetical protein VK177_06915 [Flavobacteriales bacterium]|nr:hypothetical protein [Flavobacteriales bacterium]
MRNILLASAILLVATLNLACKCGWNGNFLRVASNEDLVVKAKILGHARVHSDLDEKMTIEILTVFRGKEKRKKITVWGDDGKSCRPYVNIFKKGDIYYLGLHKEENEYEISVCGEYWLQVKNGKIKMSKNEEDEKAPAEMTTKAFDEMLKTEMGN